jgi:hypothetical protein
MMTQLSLSFLRKARVWTDELPELQFVPGETLEQLLQPAEGRIPDQRKAAVELLAPKGPMAMYGLLGAEFTPDNSNVLRVRVLLGRPSGEKYRSPLVMQSEQPTVGLVKEFAEPILQAAVAEIIKAKPWPSGQLTFARAVQGAAGSNSFIFKQLSAILVRLILLPARQPSKEELEALF